MKRALHHATTSLRIIIAIAAIMIVALLLIITGRAYATSSTEKATGSLLTIHDRTNETVVLTKATTIGQALKESGIELSDQDVVEPAASEKIIASEYQVNIYRARPVLVIDGATRQRVMTPYQTAPQIAKSVGIELYPEDIATIARSDDLLSGGAGLELRIKRATQFSLQLYGQKTTARTQATTIGGMLKEKNIKIAENDRVSLDINAPLTAGMEVAVWREGRQTVTVEQVVAFDTQEIQDANQPVGYRLVQSAGKQGKQNVTYDVEIRDGVEVSRTQIASLLTEQPVTEVVVVGTYLPLSAGYSSERVGLMNAAGIAPADQGYAAYIIDHENATWCPTRWQGQNNCPAVYVALYAEGANIGYGMCQATPGNKMATAGSDWKTNPVTQLKWCASYAIGRYGSWQAAYNFKVARGWW